MYACLLLAGALARPGGPTAGREGWMEACGLAESQRVETARMADTLMTDMPGNNTSTSAFIHVVALNCSTDVLKLCVSGSTR